MSLVDHWPLFGLRIRTPRVELRYPTDDDASALAELAERGIHDPDTMPFGIPWTDQGPAQHLQFFWRNRAEWTPEQWHCPLVTLLDEEVVGTQGIFANHFATLRTFETGSWLGRAHQGKGIGKEMRAAIVHLGFAGLSAIEAVTGAWHDNHPSLGVTRALGYLDNGEQRMPRRDEGDRMLKFRLPREVWEQRRRDDIEIEGLEPCLELFGARPHE
jgi:RimJ/RimL family protein N-acetyltransferase